MTTGQMILGILLFAAVTAILYVWGLRKSMTQAANLERGKRHCTAILARLGCRPAEAV